MPLAPVKIHIDFGPSVENKSTSVVEKTPEVKSSNSLIPRDSFEGPGTQPSYWDGIAMFDHQLRNAVDLAVHPQRALALAQMTYASIPTSLSKAISEASGSAAENAVNALKNYHGYEVKGAKNIPSNGPVLLVLNHSFATYDAILLGDEIGKQTGRKPKFLVDKMFFKVPGVSELAQYSGLLEGTRENARKALKDEELVIVLPGGMKEALKPSSERYKLKWGERKGFARMALEAGAKVVVGACPAADDIYTVYENPVTKAVYQNFRAPFPVFSGRQHTPIPRPVKLTHVLSEPIEMPKFEPDAITEKLLVEQKNTVKRRMEETMEEALALKRQKVQ